MEFEEGVIGEQEDETLTDRAGGTENTWQMSELIWMRSLSQYARPTALLLGVWGGHLEPDICRRGGMILKTVRLTETKMEKTRNCNNGKPGPFHI